MDKCAFVAPINNRPGKGGVGKKAGGSDGAEEISWQNGHKQRLVAGNGL